ncbi:hypothetical protein FB45DRAFT_1040160 [Roridomyces roridus]|uniref:Uncharacterized protein n=1 Tax=Roridomyces roridus TaxID=1738132 RepID=A0AAD7B180_9AGAR|nr:hypothetical protein FB45DRAFT_1040160 [Roridomyces roridus]
MLLGNPVPRINTAEAEAALNASWVLIDTDQPSDWIPGIWVKNGKITVWTVSPAQHRMDHYKKQIEAKTWVMKSWSMDEVAAYMTLMSKPRQAVLDGVEEFGLIPRYIFMTQDITSDSQSLDDIIYAALENIFITDFDPKTGIQDGSHRMFLVNPQRIKDVHGVPRSPNRKHFSFEFLSNCAQ